MLETLKNYYENYLAQNSFIGKPERLYDSMNYIMNLGGKRIRPILTLMGAEICGGDKEEALPIAHAMEVFHNFTLVHDDIMDEAPTRRNQATLHLKEDIATAILAGDNMLIASYNLILKSNLTQKLLILETLSQTGQEICEGQQMDMDFEKEERVGIEKYLEMIKLKTAVLLGCCLKSGSLCANAPETTANALYDFGVNTGIAFQIMDDYLDAFGEPKLTGKQPGGDIIAGKKTVLYNLAVQDANALQIQQLSIWFDKSKTSAAERLQLTLELFDELKIAQKSTVLMEKYFEKAKACLGKSGLTNEATMPLKSMIDFLRNRSH